MSTLPRRDVLRLGLAAGGIGVVGAVGLPSLNTSAIAATSRTRVQPTCTRLITQSTGNVYWADNQVNETPRTATEPDHFVTIRRASKHRAEGARLLLSRSRKGELVLGRPTWAEVGAGWWGFVGVGLGDRSEIWRFDLGVAGAAPTVLVRSSRPALPSSVEADGAHVYWSDSAGAHRVPVLGGAVQDVVTGPAITELQLDQDFLYYLQSRRRIIRVPRAGGAPTLLLAASSGQEITSLRVRGGWMVWSTTSGAVTQRQVVNGKPLYLQTSSLKPVAIDFDGTSTAFTVTSRRSNGIFDHLIVTKSFGRQTSSLRLAEPAAGVLVDSTGFNWLEGGSLWRSSY